LQISDEYDEEAENTGLVSPVSSTSTAEFAPDHPPDHPMEIDSSGTDKKWKTRTGWFCLGVLLTIVIILLMTFIILKTGGDDNAGPPPPSKPGVPGWIKMDPTFNGYIMEWDLEDRGNSQIMSYDLKYRIVDDMGVQSQRSPKLFKPIPLPDSGLSESATVIGLYSESTYCFRIRAINEIGTGEWTSQNCGRTEEGQVPGEPSSPLLIDYTFVPKNKQPQSFSLATIGWTVDRTDIFSGGEPVETYILSTTIIENDDGNGNGASEISTEEELRQWLVENPISELKSLPQSAAEEVCRELLDDDQIDIEFGDIVEFECVAQIEVGEKHAFTLVAENSLGESEEGMNLFCVFPISGADPLCVRENPPAPLPAPEAIAVTPASIVWQWQEHSNPEVQLYEIGRDSWFQYIPLTPDVESRGSATTYTVPDLVPGTPHTIRVRSFNDFGISDWSDALVVSTADQGACGNSEDTAEWRTWLDDWEWHHGVMDVCYKSTPLNKDQIIRCQMEDFHISYDCSECWYGVSHCGALQCTFQCLDGPMTPQCYACINENCRATDYVCTGMPPWSFPGAVELPPWP